ncbi:MAG: class I SAM-dependent methyltransferase [Magnetococcales bacterium]|nr:class I SAM-dependent methyltransferase [Magnetococcales bacterium]MBF0148666.1 class I SAM-dependent methyltransferase [Magnetococcales bacterium]MBF0174097.1 class I SAM-dependent methyltransferase [Magnetococcales bacterium]MBF0346837.1 class I SAM-dependent methyltransferase [Magnetococcales bacterium]MBF0631472.1 class I SAM-dependent methyltransferase [Magnetococcales bacterium]
MSHRESWNARYSGLSIAPSPARVLTEYHHLLPRTGQGLDLACGLGGNALFLAQRGLETLAWDLSEVAVQRLNEMGRAQSLPLSAEVRDVVSLPPLPESFDCVVVSRFLDRRLADPMMASLKHGGVLFYQTFTCEKNDDVGPKSTEHLLGINELLSMFSPLRLLVYREEGTVGDRSQGWRHEAMLVGMKV